MWLERNSELALGDGRYLRSEYVPKDGGVGRLSVGLLDESGDELATSAWDLDPWAPEGFVVYDWKPGGACLVCGATHVLLIESSSLALCGAVPLESGEYQTLSTPWFVASDKLLVLASEWRVACIDRRIALRWIWSTRTYSADSWMIAETPELTMSSIRVRLARLARQQELNLRTIDASIVT